MDPQAQVLENVSPKLLPELRAYLERHRAELDRMLASPGECGLLLGRRHAKIMDGLLTALFPAAYAAMRRGRKWPIVQLAAVGGYGRGVLGIKSDLDVRLFTTDPPEKVQPIAEALLYPLWDAGVSIGHQVVSISDVLATAKDDLPTATALLDFRPIAGDPVIGRQLLEKAFAGLFSEGNLLTFLQRLDAEVVERHGRFGGSVYLLEPDVKNGAGGLRDLDNALWAARARWRVEGFSELVRLGVLVGREAREIDEANDFHWTLRNHLHRHAGRRSDRLTFEEQEVIARDMRYAQRVAANVTDPNEAAGIMVEAFMSDYYRHARTITRAREQIIARATPRSGRKKPREEDLGSGLRTFDGQLTFGDVAQLSADPSLVFRLYAVAVAKNLPLLPFARDTVVRLASDPDYAARLRSNAAAAKLFVELTMDTRDTRFRRGSALAEMHDVGLLTAMIPEFAPVVGRVHHDTYHVYTVDVHSVAAVDRLRALVRGDLAQDFALGSRLAAEVTQPAVLFLATLLHDVGKAIGGKDHSKRGAVMAESILARLGLSPDDVQQGCQLILNHLSMYHVATRRDVEDPQAIAEFADSVHDRDGLRNLYLLTVSDLSTTSPTSMTSWKARMLDELYLSVDAFFSGGVLGKEERVEVVRKRVRAAWPTQGSRPALDGYLGSMPDRYFLSNTFEEIVAHAEIAIAAAGAVGVGLVPSRHTEAAELCVVAPDRPGLLAAVTAAIAASRLEVHKAEIHSRTLADGQTEAVDLFWVRDRFDGASGVERVMTKLEQDLRAVVAGQVAAETLVAERQVSRWAERPSPPVTTHVSIDSRSSSLHTIVEVFTRDRPGLLFTLARALHALGLTIVLAKINTEGTRVADVFYVSEADGGGKVAAGERAHEVRESLVAALAETKIAAVEQGTPVTGNGISHRPFEGGPQT